ncbi:MAG: UTP--glucose-1-phosphate uridylyltransferase GalU [Clostridiales bacterium]|nr:UTP--glucose-1-phosphate uridylyltransferase GalU [Clostridiales bacterium]
MSKTVKKAIIPAAGLGTRFLPATKASPKEMLPIVDKPTIQYIVEEAVASGIEDILIISGRTKRSIEDHFDKSYELENELEKAGKLELLASINEISELANIHYVRQKEPRGLGHAIACGCAFVGNEPFAVLLGDDVVYNPPGEMPCLRQLIDQYERNGASILGVQEVPRSEVNKYGIVAGKEIRERLYTVDELVEKPDPRSAPSRIAILGRYIINPQIFHILEHTKPGAGNEIQLTDGLNTLAQGGNMLAYKFKGRRYDVGTRLGFLEATVEFALRRDDIKGQFAPYLKDIIMGL